MLHKFLTCVIRAILCNSTYSYRSPLGRRHVAPSHARTPACPFPALGCGVLGDAVLDEAHLEVLVVPSDVAGSEYLGFIMRFNNRRLWKSATSFSDLVCPRRLRLTSFTNANSPL